jgi:hypothetical protein
MLKASGVCIPARTRATDTSLLLIARISCRCCISYLTRSARLCGAALLALNQQDVSFCDSCPPTKRRTRRQYKPSRHTFSLRCQCALPADTHDTAKQLHAHSAIHTVEPHTNACSWAKNGNITNPTQGLVIFGCFHPGPCSCQYCVMQRRGIAPAQTWSIVRPWAVNQASSVSLVHVPQSRRQRDSDTPEACCVSNTSSNRGSRA